MAKAPTTRPPVPTLQEKILESAEITPTRPLRRAWNFIAGTIEGTLNGMARWTKTGLFLGAIGGMLVGPSYIFTGLLLGMAGAILLGATVGFLTGGYQRLKHGDQREAMQRNGRTPRGLVTQTLDRDRVSDMNAERIFQQSQELSYDQSAYWTSRVEAEPRGRGGRGW
ncbi:MAG: hypothetical protein ACK52W_07360 [Alphaproteobacteria bacterium]